MKLLRFFTAGNVDDGKSTLIGRLLFDSNSISTDIIEALTRQTKVKGSDTDFDLALLTDGLRAEREQGITIDVAYKYFSTPNRKFIIADTPGHIQYTRNMFTGASTADLAIILIDVLHGITEQTKRHTIISSMLRIPKILVCINKMDLINYNEETYAQLVKEYQDFAQELGLQNIDFIPVSALEGENIVKPTEKMTWFQGLPLLSYLENVEIKESDNSTASLIQVQYVNNIVDPITHKVSRRFLGRVQSGQIGISSKINVWPEGTESKISGIYKYGQSVEKATEGEIVALQLSDEIDVSRGNTISVKDQNITSSNEWTAKICWMNNMPYHQGQKILLQHQSLVTKVKIQEIIEKIDIHSNLPMDNMDHSISLNEICTIKFRTAVEMVAQPFADNRNLGSFILIDENTNDTVAGGIIL
ncbi:MAG: GTP-binding protein [Saprospiraceae bacterium]